MKSPRDLMMAKLELIAAGSSKEKRITGPGEYPPCYNNLFQYMQWQQAAQKLEGAPPPVRKDWPKEPNYCRDCTAGYRNRMRDEGRCLFPSTIFVEVGEKDELETVGTSP
ncbi:hypothetical protein LCGC14_0373670 [marine sediment metagenome]|uniref:Uncharacterized protein n=1 Tax=marine sediment metagenome TaxID=412755 RepID=A0A0F9TMK6_9ZZZZ